jgi:phosphate starvation-inducible membrane PsiE
MPFTRWLNVKELFLLVILFLFSSTVAVSDSAQDLSDSSSYASTTDLLIYGLVGSNLLNDE